MGPELPTVSVVIPTLNAAGVLGSCLQSITAQNYPKDNVEIIIADGGSTDATLDIAARYGCRVTTNPLVTAEAGKAAGVKAAKNDIVALVDSDNILPDRDWMKKMVAPFTDSGIIGSEPLYYTYRREDGYITRYCALIGMNDPLCLFLGNYDRYCYVTGRWTGLPVQQEDRGDYILLRLKPEEMPTIGANGTMIRRSALLETGVGDYLFDIDVIYELVTNGKTCFAKVKVGIIHLYSKTASNFMKKQRRRIEDYAYYKKLGVRKYPWGTRKERLLYFVLCCGTVVPLIYQESRGYTRKPDPAWLFHVPACWITLFTYAVGAILTRSGNEIADRSEWRQ
jgi:glycosyltransferase involved in cell wall biosynthesis